jgi:hypothetical protein
MRSAPRAPVDPAKLADRIESASRKQLVAALASLDRRHRVALEKALLDHGASYLHGHREERRHG